MSIGCFFFPHFPFQVESGGNPSIQGQPVIIGGFPHERKSVLDASETALSLGVADGMPLRQAYGLCPEAIFLPADEDSYRKAFEEILCLLEEFSSTVEDDEWGLAFIENPFEVAAAEYIDDIRRTIGKQTGFNVSASCANGKFIAHIAARVATSGSMLFIPRGTESQFLSDLPVGFLPGPVDVMRRLELLGIVSIGQLASLPRNAVSEEFGLTGEFLWDLSNGIDKSVLVSRQIPQRIEEGFCFESSVDDEARLIAEMKIAVNRLVLQLNQRWQCCSKMTLSLGLDDGHIVQDAIDLKAPTSSPDEILRQIHQRLKLFRVSRPISEVRISLSDTCPEKGSQMSLINDRSRVSGSLLKTIKRLQQRYRQPVVRKLIPSKSNSKLPEQAYSLGDFS